MASSDEEQPEPTPTDDSLPYVAFTTSADSLFLFENNQLTIITSAPGEVTLSLQELRELFADLERMNHLSTLRRHLLSD